MDLDSPAKRLRWARENKTNYKTGTDAARAFGWPISTYLGHENGDRSPRKDAAKRYAAAYKVPWPWLLDGGPLSPSTAEADAFNSYSAPLPVQPMAEVTEPAGRPDIPVWASVAAGDGDGEMILVDSPIDYVRRSEKMLTVKSPFAFYIVGDSMEPRFSAGDQVVINPSQPVKVGDDCVFIHTASDGTMFGLVKRLVRNLADHYRVRQFNPPKELDLSKRKWSKAYRVAETRHRG